MASRFWAAQGASESEDESDSREEESDNEQEIKVPTKFGRGTAAAESSDSESEAPQKRVVRSARDRTIDELQNTANKIKNAMNINDWSVIHTEFDKLNKQLQKAQTVLAKEGTPRFYFKSLVTLEDFVKKTHENKDKKMTSTNLKAFNTFRNFLKKHNKNYEKQIEEYRKNPDEEEKKRGSDNEANENEEDEDFFDTPAASSQPKLIASPLDDEDEEEEEEEEEESDESEEEASGPSKWMLKAGEKKEEPKKKEKEKKDKEPKDRVKKVKKVQPAEGAEKKPTEMNEEDIKKKLGEILAARGKRNTDPYKQIQSLTDLVNYASNKGAELQLEILTHLISSQFDVNRSATGSMPVTLWKACHDNLTKMLNILEQNPAIALHDVDVDDKPAAFSADGESDGFEMEEEQELKLVSGNLVAFIQRLDDEFTKSLQSIDPHTKDYIQRLQDEASFLELAERGQTYYEKTNKPRQAARIAARRVEHLYYKSDAHSGAPAAEVKDDSKVLLDKLAHLIYNNGDERSKTRTILCQIYHHSLHDRFYQARDMMLMSHLQESIGRTDIPTQILFNRTMVQLGLCAFRSNLIKQAHSCLMEICSSRRIKELLAQGTNTSFTDRSPDQEKLERKRQLPYHMHINLDLVDAVHLISAMLLEIPNMAQNALDTKKKVISRTFRNLLDYFERQVFTGPPENTRDVIMTAAKGLQRGEWKQTVELLLGLPIWAFLQNSDKVKEALKRKIQEEGLRTYIFTYSSYYDSMSLNQLAESFELSKNTIHSLVSKMMISEELHAAWDQPTAAIVMHKAEATRLQYLALQLAEKAATFVENNERLLEAKTGQPSGQTAATYGYKDGKQQQKDRWQDQRQQQRGGQKQSGGRNQQQRFQNQNQRKGQSGGRNQQQNQRNYSNAY